MEALGLREKDIEEKFIRSSGSGGQKVNKTSTCVYLRHIPTGIEVKCMRERSQSLNRFFARRELVEKISKVEGQITSGRYRDGEDKTTKGKKEKEGTIKIQV